MARYDYRCPSCGHNFEVEHPMGEHPEVSCPECGQEAERVFGASAISFHGSGFYNTDRGGSSATEASSGVTSSDSSSTSPACENCPHKQSA